MIEIKVKVSDEETTLTEKFLRYEEDITLSRADPVLSGMVQHVIDKFKGDGSDPRAFVNVKIEW